MARKTKEEALKTREAIMDASIEVFFEQGVTRTSLAEIAKKAGVTRGAIYWHFENKSALLESLWQKADDSFSVITEYIANESHADPLELLRKKYELFFRILTKDKQLSRLIQVFMVKCEAVEDAGTILLHRTRKHAEVFVMLKDIIGSAVEQGELAEDLDRDRAALAVLSYIDGLMMNWIIYPDHLDVDLDIPVLIEGMIGMLKSFPSIPSK